MTPEKIKAQLNDTVLIHYTGKDEDDLIFDTTREQEPIKIILGKGKVLAPIETAILGMAIGDSKQIHIPYAEAYGPLRSELILEIPKHHLPSNLVPQIGMRLNIPLKKLTNPLRATILAIGESSITLDANHPLAGKNLIFDIELIDIL